mmetsp:Transcript_73010/g.208096  ORF Transcript_73010/g.208096 Transcript_73010/m.208096 type:complete len:236 (+) Transcript_73010:1445-2152(+)
MAQHNALWLSGGARSVDESRKVVRGRVVTRGRVGLADGHLGSERVRVGLVEVAAEHALHLSHSPFKAFNLVVDVLRCRDQHLHARVLRYVLPVLELLLLIHRDVDRTDSVSSVRRQHPFQTIPRNNANLVALAHTQLHERATKVLDFVGSLAVGDERVRAILLDAKGVVVGKLDSGSVHQLGESVERDRIFVNHAHAVTKVVGGRGVGREEAHLAGSELAVPCGSVLHGACPQHG